MMRFIVSSESIHSEIPAIPTISSHFDFGSRNCVRSAETCWDLIRPRACNRRSNFARTLFVTSRVTWYGGCSLADTTDGS